MISYPLEMTQKIMENFTTYYTCPDGWKETVTDLNNGSCAIGVPGAPCWILHTFKYGTNNGGYPTKRTSASQFCLDLKNDGKLSFYNEMSSVWPPGGNLITNRYMCPDGWIQKNTNAIKGTCTLPSTCSEKSSFSFEPDNYPTSRKSANEFCSLLKINKLDTTFTNTISSVWPPTSTSVTDVAAAAAAAAVADAAAAAADAAAADAAAADIDTGAYDYTGVPPIEEKPWIAGYTNQQVALGGSIVGIILLIILLKKDKK